jgi:hypothetical protein
MNQDDKHPLGEAGQPRADLWLEQCLHMMAPLARTLVANGVTYPVFAQALKRVFLQAAETELQEHQRRITDSALSLLSGVHRKDVRAINGSAQQAPGRPASIASEVALRWLSDSAYTEADGQPRVLEIRARSPHTDATSAVVPTFEQLAQSVSKDFHARSVLDELERLGAVAVDGYRVRLMVDNGFVAAGDVQEILRLAAANVHDHLAAVGGNLQALSQRRQPVYPEHAVSAHALSGASVAELTRFAAKAWLDTARKIDKHAKELKARDAASRADMPAEASRFRVGMYVFHESTSTRVTDSAATAQAAKSAK